MNEQQYKALLTMGCAGILFGTALGVIAVITIAIDFIKGF